MSKYPRRLVENLIKDPPSTRELDFLDSLLEREGCITCIGIMSLFQSSSDVNPRSRKSNVSNMILQMQMFSSMYKTERECTMKRFAHVIAAEGIELCNLSMAQLLTDVNPIHLQSISVVLGADCWSILWAIRNGGLIACIDRSFLDQIFKECASQVQLCPPNCDAKMFMELACLESRHFIHSHVIDIIVSSVSNRCELVQLARLHRDDDAWGCKLKNCTISDDLADLALYGITKEVACSLPLNPSNEWRRVDLSSCELRQDPVNVVFVSRFLDEVESIVSAFVGVKQIAMSIARDALSI